MAPPVALVLGGGASFGAVQVGMVQALAEVGIVGDLVVGTSVGALNGAVLAADPATAGERLLGMWQGLRRQDVFPAVGWSGLRRMHRQDAHLVDVERLERVVAAALPVASFEELATPFTAVAVDLDAGGVHELDAGPLVPALLASASIPGILPPVRLAGRTLVDGGLLANVPVAQALARGARSMVVLDCAVPGRGGGPASLSSIIDHVNRLQMVSQLERALPSVAAQVPVVCLPAPARHRVMPYDFRRTATLVDEARAASSAFLDQLVVRGPGVHGEPYLRYRGALAASASRMLTPAVRP